MEKKMDIKKEIELLQQKLNAAAEYGSLNSSHILEISEKLDKVIVKYYENNLQNIRSRK